MGFVEVEIVVEPVVLVVDWVVVFVEADVGSEMKAKAHNNTRIWCCLFMIGA